MYSNLLKIEDNIYKLQIKQEPTICFKIFRFIGLYCNNMVILDITIIKSTIIDNCETEYFNIKIKADKTDIKKLLDYLDW
jgi:hypothetical protein